MERGMEEKRRREGADGRRDTMHPIGWVCRMGVSDRCSDDLKHWAEFGVLVVEGSPGLHGAAWEQMGQVALAMSIEVDTWGAIRNVRSVSGAVSGGTCGAVRGRAIKK